MESLKIMDEGQLLFLWNLENTSLIAGSTEIPVKKIQWIPTLRVRLEIIILMFKLLLSHNLDHYFSQSILDDF